jgi:uncharacterized membrane-anchored protein
LLIHRLSTRAVLACAAAAAWLFTSQPALAQDVQPDSKGPAKVTLGKDMATLNLPAGYEFYGEAKAKQIMESLGNGSDKEIGFIRPATEDANFAIVLEFEDTGYVEDKDAGQIDADKILESYKEGTEQANEGRKERGLGELHVTGWEQKPSYDPKQHVVIWSLQGEDEKKEQFVNYNTRMLGRHGVLSVNLLCDNAALPTVKPKSQEIVSKIAFSQGKRYEDFQSGDKVSAGGLVALIAGGALLAKKTGVLAFLAVMLKPLLLLLKAGGAKLIAVLVAGVVWLGQTLMGRKATPPGEETPPSDNP